MQLARKLTGSKSSRLLRSGLVHEHEKMRRSTGSSSRLLMRRQRRRRRGRSTSGSDGTRQVEISEQEEDESTEMLTMASSSSTSFGFEYQEYIKKMCDRVKLFQTITEMQQHNLQVQARSFDYLVENQRKREHILLLGMVLIVLLGPLIRENDLLWKAQVLTLCITSLGLFVFDKTSSTNKQAPKLVQIPSIPEQDLQFPPTSTEPEQTNQEHMQTREEEQSENVPESRPLAFPLTDLDEFQMSQLVEMRARFRDRSCVEIDEGVGTFALDDGTFLRFLRARDYDVEKASKMLDNHLNWRNKYAPGKIQPIDIANGLPSGTARLAGQSRNKEPILLAQIGRFRPYDFEDVEEFTKFCAYFFELSIKSVENQIPPVEKGILIIDLSGFSLRTHWNARAMKMTKVLVNIVQDQNPERLKKCFIYNSPSVFVVAWRVIKHWIDPVTRAKIAFITNKEHINMVLEEIDPSVLNEPYGGTRREPYPINGLEELGMVQLPE